MNWFLFLFETVPTSLGDSFGLLSAFASMPFINFREMLRGHYNLEYLNLFTGEVRYLYGANNWFTEFLEFMFGLSDSILGSILELIFAGPYQYQPTWLVIVSFSLGIFIIFYLSKFLLSLVFRLR